ncbi:MAG TPA: hypothetical protein VMT87_00795 [Vicinamibacteria bacterium]|nr:hypothetical protein [Vicinamibacteria bacterium]
MSARLALAAGCLLSALASAPAAAQVAATALEPAGAGLSLRGSGLFTIPDARVLGRGRVLAGVGVNNRDRDPLGLDVLDGSVIFAAGLGAGLEVYGETVLSRVVAMPELPAMPPPPLDLVVAPGASAPARPHYAIYAPVPYVNKRGTARFDDWVRGDALLGVKYRLAEAHGSRPALAVAGELTLPLARGLADLQSGAGTGAVDVGARLAAEWGEGPTRLVASLLYTRTGRAPHGDRVLSMDAAGVLRQDLPLELPDRFEAAAGLRRPVGARLFAIAEVSAVFEAGARTATVDDAPPLDLLGGLQARFGRARVGAALRYHAGAPPSGEQRYSPVAGLVDLTGVEAAAQADYLRAMGAAGALPALRARSQRLLAVRDPGTLPPGARLLAPTYAIRSEHQVGFVLTVALAF